MASKIFKVSHENNEKLEEAVILLKNLGYEMSEIKKTPTDLEHALTELSANLQANATKAANT